MTEPPLVRCETFALKMTTYLGIAFLALLLAHWVWGVL